MLFDRQLAEKLEALPTQPWAGPVWRHMLGEIRPELPNTRGARWNPPGVGAIYCCLDRDTAIAEGDHRLAIEPVPVSAPRHVYKIEVELREVVDLSSTEALASLGVDEAELAAVKSSKCPPIGGAVEWLGRDGLLVPSARSDGTNLVIYVGRVSPDWRFDVFPSRETLSGGAE